MAQNRRFHDVPCLRPPLGQSLNLSPPQFTGIPSGSQVVQISVPKLVRYRNCTELCNAKLRLYTPLVKSTNFRPCLNPRSIKTIDRSSHWVYVQTALAYPLYYGIKFVEIWRRVTEMPSLPQTCRFSKIDVFTKYHVCALLVGGPCIPAALFYRIY